MSFLFFLIFSHKLTNQNLCSGQPRCLSYMNPSIHIPTAWTNWAPAKSHVTTLLSVSIALSLQIPLPVRKGKTTPAKKKQNKNDTNGLRKVNRAFSRYNSFCNQLRPVFAMSTLAITTSRFTKPATAPLCAAASACSKRLLSKPK